MHKTTLYLDEAVYQRVRQLADATGQTQAGVIREAIERHVAGPRSRRPRSVGMGRGAEDLSARSEELLAGMGEDR
jgi:predicted transcriptional regulator